MKAWQPQKGESAVAYQGFSEFLEMAADRSLRAVAQKLGKSLTVIGRWSVRWEWMRRVGECDTHMAAIEQRARERALEKSAEDWASKEFAMARKLYDKAEEMLDAPVCLLDNKPRDAAAVAAEAVKMERLARGEPTDYQKIQHLIEPLQKALTEAIELEVLDPEVRARIGDRVAQIMGADIQDRSTPDDPAN